MGAGGAQKCIITNINDEIKNELMLRELPSSLDALMLLHIKVDDRVRAHRSSCAGEDYQPVGFSRAPAAAHGPRGSDAGTLVAGKKSH